MTNEELNLKLAGAIKLTVKQAAKLMGVTPRYLHYGLQDGTLPFGTAVKMDGRYSYYINAERFRLWMMGEDLKIAKSHQD